MESPGLATERVEPAVDTHTQSEGSLKRAQANQTRCICSFQVSS